MKYEKHVEFVTLAAVCLVEFGWQNQLVCDVWLILKRGLKQIVSTRAVKWYLFN